jgi:hypothetical protein
MVELLDRIGMSECKPCLTPVDTNPEVASADDAPVTDASDFRSLAGALQWLTFTRPDIAYAVQQVFLHMYSPRESHLASLKRILRYICGTLDLGLLLRPSTTTDLVVYTDADWAVAWIRAGPPWAMLRSLVTTSSLGPPSVRTLSPGLALKMSIALWLMQLPKPHDCTSSSWNSTLLFAAQH